MRSIEQLLRANIKQMQPYSSARDEFQNVELPMVFLDANENPFNTRTNRYPDTQQTAVKKILSEIKNINQNQILLGNGSDEVLDLLFRAFCEPNLNNVITLPPTYGMYGVLAHLNAVENREVVLNEEFQPDLKRVFEKIDSNTKIVFLCSPNNPTGNSFSEQLIHTLLTTFNGIVVLDEAYIDFSQKKSWLEKIYKYPNLVITQTLSKAYGMAGIRLGVLYASNEIITVLNKIKPPYNINSLTQQAAIDGLNNLSKITNQILEINNSKEMFISALKNISFVKKVYPSDANFVLIQVDNAAFRYSQLIKHGIVVRNRSTQALCANCLRITIGTNQEMNQLLTVLQSI